MTQTDLSSDLITGWKCHCPKCKSPSIFKSLFSLELKEKCENCGFNLSENDSADGPAVFLIFVLSFSIIPLALIVEAMWVWPFWLHMAVWSVAILGTAIGLLKPIKGIVIALQYRYLPETMGEE